MGLRRPENVKAIVVIAIAALGPAGRAGIFAARARIAIDVVEAGRAAGLRKIETWLPVVDTYRALVRRTKERAALPFAVS